MPRGDPLNDMGIKRKFLKRTESGLPLVEAAGVGDISRETVRNCRMQSNVIVDKHTSITDKTVEKGCWQAACWLLERRVPERFAQIVKTPDDGKLDKLVESLEKLAENK